MTTGALIYLVSACVSGEEFISAFRRYADRNGVVFIPIAVPLPPGRKGRFALSLRDGGVMIEGEAEVVSSAKTPSVLYGRVGMTLKFTEPDEPSKTLLGELEKARLQMRPSPPSVAPRPAELPASPRPTPPAPAGRIDAVNALAECVLIGDVAALTSDDGPKGGKFAVPSIPPVGPTRARPPSGAVPTVAATATTMGMPPLKAPSAAPRPPTPPVPMPAIGRETVMGMPALDRAPAPAPVVAAKETVVGMAPLTKAPASTRDDPTMPTPAMVAAAAAATSPRDRSEVLETMRGPAPGVDLLAPGKKIDVNETMRGPAPKLPSATSTPPRGTAPPPFTPRQPTPAAPAPVVPAPPIVAVAPPVPAIDDADEPTDLSELPPVIEPVVAETSASLREARKTVIGIAVVPSGVHVLPAAPALRAETEEEPHDTSVMDALPEETSGPVMITSTPPKEVFDVDPLAATESAGKKLPTGVLAATVEEATPSGDWTMIPGENGPTIAPRAPTPNPAKRAESDAEPAGPQTGDWMIALDPSKPDGWTEPSKVEKRPAGVLPPEPGPPVSTVSSAKDLDSNAKVAPEPKLGEAAKVEVDPTLMEPLQPLQPIDDFDDEPQVPPSPGSSQPAMTDLPVPNGGQMHTPLPHRPSPMPMPPGGYVTPVHGHAQLGVAGQVPAYPIGPRYPSDSIPVDDHRRAARKRRLIVIGASAAGALLLVIVLAIALGGGKSKPDATEERPTTGEAPPPRPDPAPATQVVPPTPTKQETPPPPTPEVGSGSGSAVQAAVEPTAGSDAGEPVPQPSAQPDPPPPEVVAATECEVQVTTTPPGAEILLTKDTLGTTPTTFKLPCGVETRLTFKKARFATAQRSITPKATGQKPVRVALAKVTFTVKVSSSPPGATILLGTKSLGITPATVKVPAFEQSTLKIVKEGYAPDLQKITPKSNNLSILSMLKKQPAKKPR